MGKRKEKSKEGKIKGIQKSGEEDWLDYSNEYAKVDWEKTINPQQ